MFFDVFGEFEFVAEVFALFNDLVAKEIGQLHNVVDVVTVLDVVRLVNHAHVVENVVLSGHELQQNHPHRPYVGLVRLVRVVQYRLQWHVSFSSDLVAPNYLQAVTQTPVNPHCLFDFLHSFFVFVFHFF